MASIGNEMKCFSIKIIILVIIDSNFNFKGPVMLSGVEACLAARSFLALRLVDRMAAILFGVAFVLVLILAIPQGRRLS